MSTKKTDPRTDPEWYYQNRKMLGKKAAEIIASGKATVMTKERLATRLAASKETKPVTIGWPASDIKLAKVQAEQKGLPYQTYLKSVLHQALTAAE